MGDKGSGGGRGEAEGGLTALSLVSLHWVGVVNKYAGVSHKG